MCIGGKKIRFVILDYNESLDRGLWTSATPGERIAHEFYFNFKLIWNLENL